MSNQQPLWHHLTDKFIKYNISQINHTSNLRVFSLKREGDRGINLIISFYFYSTIININIIHNVIISH